jgi:hypothetical protein
VGSVWRQLRQYFGRYHLAFLDQESKRVNALFSIRRITQKYLRCDLAKAAVKRSDSRDLTDMSYQKLRRRCLPQGAHVAVHRLSQLRIHLVRNGHDIG